MNSGTSPTTAPAPDLGRSVEIARRFLILMEERNLDAATELTSSDAVFVFPGNARHQSVLDVAKGSSRRYQRVQKNIEASDAFRASDGVVVVYVRGTLFGQWIDGTAFSGIRFIDRFEIEAGLIRRQDVWNDAGEFRRLQGIG